MLALVNTPNGPAPIELRDIADPDPARKEALVEVHAFSLNRGELASFARNKEGWVPGQDIAGVVLCQAANGAGPAVGTRVVALDGHTGGPDVAKTAAFHRKASGGSKKSVQRPSYGAGERQEGEGRTARAA